MTAKLHTTYKTREYAAYDFTIPANDDAIITNVYTTKWGKYYDVETAHNGKFNVNENVIGKMLNI